MVFSPQLLQRLNSLRCQTGILSVYLRVDPDLMYAHKHPLTEFKATVKAMDHPADEQSEKALRTEVDRVLHFLEESWQPEGRGLVVFSAEPIGLWETMTLRVPVPNAVHFDPAPHLRILARLADEYERYAAVVVDKEDAHLYIIHMGEIERQGEVFDADVPGRHDQGGWAQARFQRHTGFHVHEHLKHVLGRLEGYYHARPFDRLILGGPEEAVTEFRKMLPRDLADRFIGTFPASSHFHPDEVLERAAPVVEARERADEEALVRRVIEDAGAGGPGVVGAAGTLAAINGERVHRLLVNEGLRLSGAECSSCRLLLERQVAACPACGAPVQELPDLVERAVQRIYDSNGSVEIVFGRGAEELAAHGGIGARLRF